MMQLLSTTIHFSTGYTESNSKDLNEKEMDEYFESKPQMSDEFKELK